MDTLEEVYEHLETNSLSYKYPTNIADLFKELGQKYLASNNKLNAQKCQWEIDTYNFTIRDNQLLSMMSGTDQEGNLVEYPSLNTFDSEAFEYLNYRLSKSLTPRIKARYSHVLWLSPAKTKVHAQIAIESYLSLATDYSRLDDENPNEQHGHNYISAIKNAALLSLQIKDKIDQIRITILDAIENYNPASKSFYSIRIQLLKLVLDHKKILPKTDLLNLAPFYEELDKNLDESEGGLWRSIELNKILILLATKTNIETTKYKEKRAWCYERLSILRESNSGMISLDFCVNSINIYKELGNNKKVEELEKRYKKLKKIVNLQEVGTEIDMTETVRQICELAETLTEKPSNEIIEFLIHNEQLIPRYDFLEEEALRSKKETPLLFMTSTQIYDRNGHVAEHFGTEEESIKYAMLQSLSLGVRLHSGLLMHEIMFKAISKEKISTQILSQYFQENCWFGTNITKDLINNEKITYNWLNVIIPSIDLYIEKVKILLYNPSVHLNFVAELDSLVQKFEPLLRDFLEFLGGVSFFQTQDKSGRVITKEKDINVLLHEDLLSNMMDKNDHFYLKFLLIEKAGLNIRNYVAHGFLNYPDYNLYSFHLNLLALFRIAKYKFNLEPKSR